MAAMGDSGASGSGNTARKRRARSTRRLTAKERLFAHEYVWDHNATQAARRAGYKNGPGLRQTGHRLLTKADVASLVAELDERRLKVGELKAERLDEELARVAYLDPAALFDEKGAFVRRVQDLPEDTRRAIRSVKVTELWSGEGADRKQIGQVVEVKLEPKVDAIRLAYQRLGLLKEKFEVTATLSHEQLLILAERIREKRLAASRAVGMPAGEGRADGGAQDTERH